MNKGLKESLEETSNTINNMFLMTFNVHTIKVKRFKDFIYIIYQEKYANVSNIGFFLSIPKK